MWNRLIQRNVSPTAPRWSASRTPLADTELDARLHDLEVTPPSPSMMRGDTYATTSQSSQIVNGNMTGFFRLLDLPPELVDQVLSHLDPASLAQVACTCRRLRSFACDDRHWARVSKALKLASSHELPSPFGNWREFYAAHYPYWFLPQHKVWFADRAARGHALTGQLNLARYDYRMGHIEMYRLHAENIDPESRQWAWNPNVLIHSFNPRVSLLLDDPIVKLEIGMYESGARMQREISLTRGYERYRAGLKSKIFLARPVPQHAQVMSMALWPPKAVPAIDRVRCESSTLFKDKGHKPSRWDQMSQSQFRTRVWTEFPGFAAGMGARMGEDVATFSTLPPASWIPTAEKPYQGIFVGDYSGHGCEFLLVTQKTIEEAAGIPSITGMTEEEMAIVAGPLHRPVANASNNGRSPESLMEESDPPGCSGRLEAIKLTGDVNVPRGEYTFIAEDIGQRGLIRVAQEAAFRDARIVKCWGHIASRGFIDEGYIPSQLIMISHDCLAQYWEEFGHISFFKRLNIDEFLDVETAPSNIVL